MDDYDLICPKCGSDDMTIESNSSVQITQISCCDCEFIEDYNCPEETAMKRFRRKYRKFQKNDDDE